MASQVAVWRWRRAVALLLAAAWVALALTGWASGALRLWQSALLVALLAWSRWCRAHSRCSLLLELAAVLGTAYLIALQSGGVDSYAVAWFYIASVDYPLLIGRAGGLLPFAVALTFASLALVAPPPLPLLVMRTLLIALSGWLVYYLGGKLDAAERFYRLLAEQSSEGVAVLDAGGRLRYLSPASSRLTGYQPAALLGRPLAELVHPDDRAPLVRLIAELAPAASARCQLRFRLSDGRWRWLEVRLTNLCREPAVGGYLLSAHDIERRQQLQQALARTEAFYRTLIEQSAEGVLVFGPDKRIRFQSASGNAIAGYGDSELIGRDRSDILHPDDRGRFEAAFSALAPGESAVLEYRIKRRSGETLWLRGRLTNLCHDPAVAGYVLNYYDIGELKRSERALQALNRRLVQVQEAERRALARDLHDDVGQALTAAKVSVQAAQHSGQAAAFARALAAIDGVLARIRELSRNLHPRLLEDLGLAAALRHLVLEQTRHSPVALSLRLALPEARLPRELELDCYRVVQEGLNNILRHSQARRAQVALTLVEGGLELVMRDDGVGFDPQRTAEGLGLVSMRERVTAHGGTFEVRSAQGQGTTIRAAFPLKGDAGGHTDFAG